jgi:hypothetical protein
MTVNIVNLYHYTTVVYHFLTFHSQNIQENSSYKESHNKMIFFHIFIFMKTIFLRIIESSEIWG